MTYKFKKGDRVRVTKLEDWQAKLGAKVGMVGTVLEDYSIAPFVAIDGYKNTSRSHSENLAFGESNLELANEPWDLAIDSGEFHFRCDVAFFPEIIYHAKSDGGDFIVRWTFDREGRANRYSREYLRNKLKSGEWFIVDAPSQALNIDYLSTAYRHANDEHAVALERCTEARKAYADAEDELNSASDRLETAGKALLEAIAKQ